MKIKTCEKKAVNTLKLCHAPCSVPVGPMSWQGRFVDEDEESEIFKKYPLGRWYTDETGDPAWKEYTTVTVTVENPKCPGYKRDYNIRSYEHKMYFEWVNVKGTKNDKVTIYITETPAEFNGNPPPTSPPPPPES